MNRTGIIAVMLIITLLSLSTNLKAQDVNGLDRKQQKIVTIAANTAIGNLDALKTEFSAGLDAGLTINQIKEVLV